MSFIWKIKTYKRNGNLFKKIVCVFKFKLQTFLICFPFRLYLGIRPHENEVYYSNYKFYYVLKKRFQRILHRLPVYEENPLPNEKVIWWCWLQGEENAPDLCRACLSSLRRNLPDFKINIVTEKNMWSLVTVPEYIRNKYEKGTISRTHFSDILRTCLLVEHGGVWIDSTVYCTGCHDDILSENLFWFSNIMRGDKGISFSSWLISAHKKEPVLMTIRDLLFLYWKNHSHLYHYFIYHFFGTMALEKYPEIAEKVPVFSNVPPHIMQNELFGEYSEKRFAHYVQMGDFHKLTYKFSEHQNTKNTVYEAILNKENISETQKTGAKNE